MINNGGYLINWKELLPIISVVINILILGIGFWIHFGTKNHFDKLLEDYKAKLQKRYASEQTLKQLWDVYRNYYNTVINYSINHNSDQQNEVNKAELTLRKFLEEQAPFIPKKIMQAMNEVIDVQHYQEREKVLLSNHEDIISLFRGFFT